MNFTEWVFYNPFFYNTDISIMNFRLLILKEYLHCKLIIKGKTTMKAQICYHIKFIIKKKYFKICQEILLSQLAIWHTVEIVLKFGGVLSIGSSQTQEGLSSHCSQKKCVIVSTSTRLVFKASSLKCFCKHFFAFSLLTTNHIYKLWRNTANCQWFYHFYPMISGSFHIKRFTNKWSLINSMYLWKYTC